MAYEWFNNAVYNPTVGNTPSILGSKTLGVTTPFDVGTSGTTKTGTFTSTGGPAPSSGIITPKTPVVTTPTDLGTSQPTGTGTFTTSVTQSPSGAPAGAGLFIPPVTDTGTDKGGQKPYTPPTISKEDALFNAMMEMMKVYNIQNFAATWAKIRKDYPGITSEEALNLLRYDSRYNADYNQRFSGNQMRIKNGLGALDEKTYLETEKGFSKVFQGYELPTFDNPAQYATLIGNGVNVVEAGQRVALAYDRVLNADGGTLDAWRKFYPQLTTSDLVATMLDPKNQIPVMERKVQSAEIGGAALTQGLNASLAAETIKSQRYSNLTTGTIGAETIRESGATLATSKADYEKIAGELPDAEKLSSIYGGQLAQYGQVEAEKANILGLASEKRKLEDLIAREQAGWQGASGTSKGAFSTSYLNRQGKSGAF